MLRRRGRLHFGQANATLTFIVVGLRSGGAGRSGRAQRRPAGRPAGCRRDRRRPERPGQPARAVRLHLRAARRTGRGRRGRDHRIDPRQHPARARPGLHRRRAAARPAALQRRPRPHPDRADDPRGRGDARAEPGVLRPHPGGAATSRRCRRSRPIVLLAGLRCSRCRRLVRRDEERESDEAGRPKTCGRCRWRSSRSRSPACWRRSSSDWFVDALTPALIHAAHLARPSPAWSSWRSPATRSRTWSGSSLPPRNSADHALSVDPQLPAADRAVLAPLLVLLSPRDRRARPSLLVFPPLLVTTLVAAVSR